MRRTTLSEHNGCVVCQHTEVPVIFPDGTRVLASGWLQRSAEDTHPDYGLYLDPSWTPTWPHVLLDWPDLGVPTDDFLASSEIAQAFARAKRGETVEVACVGGHGRTGTVLACMAILAGVPPDDAVAWVRAAYCSRAVQEPRQEYWVQHRFEAEAASAPEAE